MLTNVKVYGLDESMTASGYPMMTDVNKAQDGDKVVKRMKSLGNAKPGSGHDSALKGIVVQMDWETPVLMQPQIQRYHFIDIVSSQSAMHRMCRMDLDKSFTEKVHPVSIDLIKDLVRTYNNWKEDSKYVSIQWKPGEWKDFTKDGLWEVIIHTCPQGLLKVARYTTNYLQLKTMYNQRDGHKLSEWKEFRDWCETLPLFKEFCLKK